MYSESVSAVMYPPPGQCGGYVEYSSMLLHHQHDLPLCVLSSSVLSRKSTQKHLSISLSVQRSRLSGVIEQVLTTLIRADEINRGQGRRAPTVRGKYWVNIMALSQSMVKILFEGKKLADLDFWTKSDPYLVISRPSSKGEYDFKQVHYLHAWSFVSSRADPAQGQHEKKTTR